MRERLGERPAPIDFIPGAVYKTWHLGWVTFERMDRYMGQVTCQLATEYGSRYLFPDDLRKQISKDQP